MTRSSSHSEEIKTEVGGSFIHEDDLMEILNAMPSSKEPVIYYGGELVKGKEAIKKCLQPTKP
jgi:hypothetical protein